MRRQIGFLVAATTSAVVLAFLIPLGLLVRNLAVDRATSAGDAEARNVAILVSSLNGSPDLADVVAAVDRRSPVRTTVVLADGEAFGSGGLTAADPEVLRARAGDAFTRTTDDGDVIIGIPVLTSDGTDVVVTVVTEEQLHQGVPAAWAALAVLGAGLILLATLLAARFALRIATPVGQVASVADRLREGDLEARAEPTGPEETQALAVALNRLASRVQELLIAERGVAGDLAHRLRTPLTALRLDAERVTDPEVAGRLREHVSTLQRAVDLIVRDARRPVRNAMDSSCDARAVVADRAAFWGALAEDQGRAVAVVLPEETVRVAIDETDLRDAVDVLIDNVFAHTPEATGFSVTLRTDADGAHVTVSDEGAWTTPGGNRSGHTGLGLQIARRAAEAAGGSLELTPATRGTTVTVTIPLTAD